MGAGDGMLPFYSEKNVTVYKSTGNATAHTGIASEQGLPFVGGYIGNTTDQAHALDVQLTANNGMTIYAGSCIFLELEYRQKMPGSTFAEVCMCGVTCWPTHHLRQWYTIHSFTRWARH